MNLNNKNRNAAKKNKKNELYNVLDETGFLNSMVDKSEEEIDEITKLIVSLFKTVK